MILPSKMVTINDIIVYIKKYVIIKYVCEDSWTLKNFKSEVQAVSV